MSAVQEAVRVATMRAVRIHAPSPADVAVEQLAVPRPQAGEALVRVHAAALTRGELEWPAERLPATPSYELSGEVAALGPGEHDVAVGDEVWALTPFDREGVAAEYAVVPTAVLAPKPGFLSHAQAASIPLPALTAWQGLFEHAGLRAGERVQVLGAAGGVGRLAVQLARWRGADVVGTRSGEEEPSLASGGSAELADFDLIFDTVGGAALRSAATRLRVGGRIVTVAEPPRDGLAATYFVVAPNRAQLGEIARLLESGVLEPAVDSVVPLARARDAFERLEQRGRRGKVVLGVSDE